MSHLPSFEESMKYFAEAKKIWDVYVPKNGQADTVQGELIRAIEKLRDEAQRNANGNWDKGHEFLCSFVRDTLCTSNSAFDSDTAIRIRTDIARIEDYEHPYLEDDIYDRLTDWVVEWCHVHPQPVPHEHNPDLLR
jgi:hypothetical protein